MIREDIDIEGIANTLGLPFYEDEDWKCIVIGEADWDNTGNEMELVLKYQIGRASCRERVSEAV